MKRSNITRTISSLSATLAAKRFSIPATIYASCVAALAMATRAARNGDASKALEAIEQARAFLETFAC